MLPLETDITYGPVLSRRFGWDLGLNLLPVDRKTCTFDCLYCQYGFNRAQQTSRPVYPSLKEIFEALDKKIDAPTARCGTISHITVAGNGEPTMHPLFPEIALWLRQWRNRFFPNVRLALLSNGYRLKQKSVRESLSCFDEPVIKLDTAGRERFMELNRPTASITPRKLISWLKDSPPVIIQTMFVRDWNDSASDIARWMDALNEIQPVNVQIYTISRDTALPGLKKVTARRLQQIARDATRHLGIPVSAY